MKSRNYLLAAFAGLLFGFDTGVIAGAMVFIKQSFAITATFEGLITGAVPTGAIFGALSGMLIAERLGRRPALLISAVLFLLGTLLATFATSVMMLVLARLLLGIAIGISSMNAPVYLAELAEAHLRGRLTTLFQLCITLGILSAYICNYLLAPSWRLMFFMGIIPALLLFSASSLDLRHHAGSMPRGTLTKRAKFYAQCVKEEVLKTNYARLPPVSFYRGVPKHPHGNRYSLALS